MPALQQQSRTTASAAAARQPSLSKKAVTTASSTSPENSSASTAKDGLSEQARQALAAAAYFCSGAIAINASQLIAQPLSHLNKDWYERWMTLTKGTFGLLLTTTTQLFAPTVIRLSGDASVRGQLLTDLLPSSSPSAGAAAPTTLPTALLAFPPRLVLMANHQTYTDWLYLWWAAYAAGQQDAVHIVLKDSLRHLPVLGWGMALSRFIFLKREWKHDRAVLAEHMARLAGDCTDPGGSTRPTTPNPIKRKETEAQAKRKPPMWLLLFPEGTNLAPCTRARSAAWARKSGLRDVRHVLLPRATGLRFMLSELRRRRDSGVEWLYDATLAYDGVGRGEFAQDVFPLPGASWFGGGGAGAGSGTGTRTNTANPSSSSGGGSTTAIAPKAVNIHFRRFRIVDIPGLSDLAPPSPTTTTTTSARASPPQDDNDHTATLAFTSWLLARWREKDALLEHYHAHGGRFPADRGVELDARTGELRRGAGMVEVPIRARGWREFLRVCAPVGVLALLILLGLVRTVPGVGEGVREGILAGLGGVGGGDNNDKNGQDERGGKGTGQDGRGERGAAKAGTESKAGRKLLAFNGTGFVPVADHGNSKKASGGGSGSAGGDSNNIKKGSNTRSNTANNAKLQQNPRKPVVAAKIHTAAAHKPWPAAAAPSAKSAARSGQKQQQQQQQQQVPARNEPRIPPKTKTGTKSKNPHAQAQAQTQNQTRPTPTRTKAQPTSLTPKHKMQTQTRKDQGSKDVQR